MPGGRMPGGRARKPGGARETSRPYAYPSYPCGTNTLYWRGRSSTRFRLASNLRAAGPGDGDDLARGRPRTWGLADGRGLSPPTLLTRGLADGLGFVGVSEEVADFRSSSLSEVLVAPWSSLSDSLRSTRASSLTGGGGGGGMSVRAFALGMTFALGTSTGPGCFDEGAITRRCPSASTVAACLAPAAPAPEVFGIHLALAESLARDSICSTRWDSSSSDSSGSEGSGGGGLSQSPPNRAGSAGTVEAATAACAGGVGFGAGIEPPLPLDPGGGRATACLSRARGGRRGRHEGQMAKGQARGQEQEGNRARAHPPSQ